MKENFCPCAGGVVDGVRRQLDVVDLGGTAGQVDLAVAVPPLSAAGIVRNQLTIHISVSYPHVDAKILAALVVEAEVCSRLIIDEDGVGLCGIGIRKGGVGFLFGILDARDPLQGQIQGGRHLGHAAPHDLHPPAVDAVFVAVGCRAGPHRVVERKKCSILHRGPIQRSDCQLDVVYVVAPGLSGAPTSQYPFRLYRPGQDQGNTRVKAEHPESATAPPPPRYTVPL